MSEQKQTIYTKQAAASKQQQTSSINETTTNPGCTAKDTPHNNHIWNFWNDKKMKHVVPRGC